MKTFITLFALIALPVCCLGQITIKDTARLPFLKVAVKAAFKQAPQFDGSQLDSIGKELKNGNKTALLAIAPYLDDTNRITRFLGYHILKRQRRDVALSLLIENTSFLQSEINLNSKTSTSDWLKFTDANFDKIAFDTDAGVFLLTPMSRREVQIEALELTQLRNGDLHRAADRLLNLPWLKEGEIDMLIGLKDNYALYKIASRLYRTRTRFNDYQDDGADYINLLQLLTGVDIGVKNEKGEITHHIEKDYSLQSRENLLIYFAKNYEAFKWGENRKWFVNEALQAGRPLKETLYFEQFGSKDNTVAINAFINLTTADTAVVNRLANEYDRASIDFNWALPTFPYRFIKKLSALTDYCKRRGIDFRGTNKLRQSVALLRTNLSFVARRQLEQKLITSLSLKDITALEYWCMVYEKDSQLTYSTGRILDIFYSKNWNRIISDTGQLSLYLKKCTLYKNLGIIGNCNNFLVKFIKMHSPTIDKLKALKPVDKEIWVELSKAIRLAESDNRKPEEAKKINDANYDTEVKDFKAAFEDILQNNTNQDSLRYKTNWLLAKISYTQIGAAIRLVQPVTFFRSNEEKYSFLDRDFGFMLVDFTDSLVKKEFMDYYSSHSEYQVYRYYLDKAGIDYKGNAGKLDYDKAYHILKFNINDSFVGGGGGKKNSEVYLVIKLLELTFKSTLGFPKKLCNSGNLYGCDASDRAREWMNYLKEKGLLKLPHNEPYSFSYFDN